MIHEGFSDSSDLSHLTLVIHNLVLPSDSLEKMKKKNYCEKITPNIPNICTSFALIVLFWLMQTYDETDLLREYVGTRLSAAAAMAIFPNALGDQQNV